MIQIETPEVLIMGRKSTKEDKNVYFQARTDANLTRERASEVTSISESRIEKIELQNALPHPDEVLAMARAYGSSSICNYFCSHECKIGQEYVPEIRPRVLSQAVLELLAALNDLEENRNRLISITADGLIDETEIRDLARIQNELGRVSMAIDSFNLWINEQITSGVIDNGALLRERELLEEKPQDPPVSR